MKTRTHTDAQALNQIAEVLNTRAWDIDAVSAIAAAVRASGRVVEDVTVERELAQLKTVMDALRKHIKIEPE